MTKPITLILPIRNESKIITNCLESIFHQTFEIDELEILVVDGMSDDNTREVVLELAKAHPQVRLLDNPGRIVPTGMNVALRQAKGDVIIRVDGHCLINPDYVANCLEHLQMNDVDGVGGPMETIGETTLSETIAVGMSSTFGVGDSAFRTINGKTMLVDSVPFPAYKRSIIEKVGLYDEELVRNQDDEYNYRIREAGGKILLADGVRSKYYSRASLTKLWSQYYQYGYWKVRVLQKHPLQMSLRQFVPPTFVLSLILSLILAFATSWGWFLLFLIAASYIFANLGASILTAQKKGWQHIWRLPLVFAILHISYGSGFLVGLGKFWNRWGDKVGKVPPFTPVER